ncbi:MAG: hypothetical protein MK082_05845 [Phycisphaerales bacterium]|nr:hypothetical protein [Phycisphaerales bacterium]
MSEDQAGNDRRGCRSTFLIGAILACLLLVTGFVLTLFQPDGHLPPSASDPVVVDRSNIFEQEFASACSRVREDESPWAIRLREEDLNAWLWVRLPAWVAHLGGTDAYGTTPMFQARVEPGRVVITTDTVAIAFRSELVDGDLRIMPATGSSMGRLPVPSRMVELLMGSIELPTIGDVLLPGGDGATYGLEDGELVVPARHRLGDDRVVELLEVQIDEGEVVLVMRTLPPPSG